jgi:hypothetical protein
MSVFLNELKNKASTSKEQATAHKNKLDSENEEKARQAAERKAKDEQLVSSQLLMNSNATNAFVSIGEMTSVIKETMPSLVRFIHASPLSQGQIENATSSSFTTTSSSNNDSELLVARLEHLEHEFTEIKNIAEANARKNSSDLLELKEMMTVLIKRKRDD